jgi:deazaflavin-dependent oxidoreductase (nitroreductase family)
MSVQVPRSGTRGLRLPRFLARLGNRFVLRQFRRGTAKTQGGVATLLLETVGARSGEIRQAVLGYIAEPAGSWLVMASAAGAVRNPAWLHNLSHNPEATVQFADGVTVTVTAETLDGDALDAAWQLIAVDAPEYVRYRSKTDREIAVVRLRRR